MQNDAILTVRTTPLKRDTLNQLVEKRFHGRVPTSRITRAMVELLIDDLVAGGQSKFFRQFDEGGKS